MTVDELIAKFGLKIDEAAFNKANSLIGGLHKGLGAIAGTVFAAGSAFAALIGTQAAAADKMGDLASSAGLTSDSFQRLASAANKAEGTAPEEFANTLGILAVNLKAAKDGSEEAGGAFAKLGIKISSQQGKLRNADDVFLDLAEKFEKMPDSAEKVALARKILGKSGKEMIPLLNHGRAELEAFAASATIFTKEQIDAGDEIGRSWRSIIGQGKGLVREVIGPLLPGARDVVKTILAWVKANREMLRQRVEQTVRALAAAFKVLVEALILLGRAANFVVEHWKTFALIFGVSGLVVGVYRLVQAFTALRLVSITSALAALGAWLAVALPLIAITVIIGLLIVAIQDIYTAFKGGESVLDKLYSKWSDIIHEWTGTTVGDRTPWDIWLKDLLATIWDIDDAWHDVINDIKQWWNGLLAETMAGIQGWADKIKSIFGSLASVSPIFTAAINAAGEGKTKAGGIGEPTLSPGRTGSTAVNAPFNGDIIINAPSGDAKELRRQFREAADEWFEGALQEAHAASGGG